MELSEFLLARIAEDEAEAVESCFDQHPGADVYHQGGHPDRKRLAECDAKRRIVERHPTISCDPGFPTVFPDEPYCAEDGEEQPCPTMRLLALPYADHPDYRDEWKP